MIPADPENLAPGDVIFIRQIKNAGSGQEPEYFFREARVHEAKPKVVFLKYKDQDYRLTHKVRPCMVFLNAEVERVSTVPAPMTPKEAAQDIDLSRIQKVEAVVAQPPIDPDDLFGEPVSRKVSKKKAAVTAVQTPKPTSNGSTANFDFNPEEFKAWLEMGKSFAHIPARLKRIREEAEQVAGQLNAIEKKYKELMEEERTLTAQHKEMLCLLGASAEALR